MNNVRQIPNKLSVRGIKMKQGIHPKYFVTTVSCACGNQFITGATKRELKVDICSKCHPFYTGVQKVVDTTGRLERFTRKYNLNKKED